MSKADTIKSHYDVVIIGGGHNELVAACYLAKACMSVLVLERNAELGGATQSKRTFVGIDARLSAYAYLVSLFPQKICRDLGLNLKLKSRGTASYTPSLANGRFRELLIRNGDSACNRDSFLALTENNRDYQGYLQLQDMQHRQATSSIAPASLRTKAIMMEQSQRFVQRHGGLLSTSGKRVTSGHSECIAFAALDSKSEMCSVCR